MKVSWTIFKGFVQSRLLSIQWLDLTNKYWMKAFDGLFELECELLKDPSDTTELLDFENNFKALGNKKLDPRDSDGSPLQRTKVTTTGWNYCLHGLEFETSKLDSIYSRKPDNTDYNFHTIKFYKDVSGAEVEITGDDLNQTFLDANCIKTIVDWEPTFDYEIVGGSLKQKSVPTEDVHLWVIGVPDIPEAYGGSKVFVTTVDLAYIGLEDGVKVDGRAPKYLTYSATNHTSKLRLVLRHPVGYKHKLHMLFEIFKA